jgi:glutamate dehydrogenase (NAD(P)+)
LKGYTVPGVVTGKPISVGGSLGRAESTGKGVAYCINFAAKYLKMNIDKNTTVSIQGFGKVGIPAAQDLAAQGAKIVAISDVSGAIYNPEGINLNAAIEWTHQRKLLKDMPGVKVISNEELIALKVDVFVPAAIDGVVTKANAHNVKAKIIAEGANGPLTKEAVDICTKNGAFIIPDILCNAGGVIVSYFEWVQGLQNFFWDLDQVNDKLHGIMKNAFDRVVETHEHYKCDMKKAALIEALKRLQGAMRLRGLFPA